MNFMDVVRDFLAYQETKGHSNGTVDTYKKSLEYFHRFLSEEWNAPVFLEDIREADIENFLGYLQQRQAKPNYRKKNLGILRSFFKFCVKKQYLQFNIAQGLDSIKVVSKERVYLTDQEVARIVEAADNLLVKVMITTLYFTGLRISELTNLTLMDVDLGNDVLYVQGKGAKERHVPIHDNLKSLLLTYREKWRPELGTDYFFCTFSGSVSAVYFRQMLKETVAKAGIGKKVTPHTLRHSFASSLVRKNVPLVRVQKLLGHSSLNATSVYTHTNLEELRESLNQVN